MYWQSHRGEKCFTISFLALPTVSCTTGSTTIIVKCARELCASVLRVCVSLTAAPRFLFNLNCKDRKEVDTHVGTFWFQRPAHPFTLHHSFWQWAAVTCNSLQRLWHLVAIAGAYNFLLDTLLNLKRRFFPSYFGPSHSMHGRISFSLAFSLARLCHLISLRNRLPKHLKRKFHFRILFVFQRSDCQRRKHAHRCADVAHTHYHPTLSLAFNRGKIVKCVRSKHICVAFISICAAITYDAPNVWRFYHFDDAGVGRSLLNTTSRRIFVLERHAIWIGLESLPPQTTTSPTEDAFVGFLFLFFSSERCCGNHTITIPPIACHLSYFNEPFSNVLCGAGGCCCPEKCKYSLSASAEYDSHIVHTKHMYEES